MIAECGSLNGAAEPQAHAMGAHESSPPTRVTAPACIGGLQHRRLAVVYDAHSDLDAARTALLADVRALEACVRRYDPAVRDEIVHLLQGAVNVLASRRSAAEEDPGQTLRVAAEIVDRASQRYRAVVHAWNRLLFALSAFAGVLVVVGVPLGVHWLAEQVSRLSPDLASWSLTRLVLQLDVQRAFALLGFSGLGSVASVLTRLNRLDFGRETSKWLVRTSGLGRPVVAAIFAIVVFAAFNAQLVPLGSPSAMTPPHYWCWVIAFFCGYSERFANDLFGRVGFGASDDAVPAANGAQPKVGTALASRSSGVLT